MLTQTGGLGGDFTGQRRGYMLTQTGGLGGDLTGLLQIHTAATIGPPLGPANLRLYGW